MTSTWAGLLAATRWADLVEDGWEEMPKSVADEVAELADAAAEDPGTTALPRVFIGRHAPRTRRLPSRRRMGQDALRAWDASRWATHVAGFKDGVVDHGSVPPRVAVASAVMIDNAVCLRGRSIEVCQPEGAVVL